jgi:hypothetical protein
VALTPWLSEPQCDRPYSANWSVSSAQATQTYLADTVQTLRGGNIPLAALGNLGEDPWFDERSARDHDAVDAAALLLLPVRLCREAVAVAEDRDRGHARVLDRVAQDVDALAHILPVGELGVALLPRAAVQLGVSLVQRSW